MQPKAWDTLRCLLMNRSINEEPVNKRTQLLKKTFNDCDEDELDIIIDDADGRSQASSRDYETRSTDGRSISSKLLFSNPIRQISGSGEL